MDATALCEGSAQLNNQSLRWQRLNACLFDIPLGQCEKQETLVNVVSLEKVSIFSREATRQINGTRERHTRREEQLWILSPLGRPCVPTQMANPLPCRRVQFQNFWDVDKQISLAGAAAGRTRLWPSDFGRLRELTLAKSAYVRVCV